MSRDTRVLLLSLAAGAPGAIASIWLSWAYLPSAAARWSITVLVLGVLVSVSLALQAEVVRPLQSLANVLAGIREGDFSLRAGRAQGDDAASLALNEANAIADALRGERFDSLEAAVLLGAVMAEIEVSVFAFDEAARLVLVNRAGAQLLGRSEESLPGRSAVELGLAEALGVESAQTLELSFAGRLGRFEARTRAFRREGRPHRVLVLADLRRALREEERQAWQRLIRVLSHEINNSLTPIQSLAESLTRLLERAALPDEQRADLRQGLSIIGGRADAVARFMASYARLARLPAPRLQRVDVGACVRRVAALETRVAVQVREGPPVVIRADGDQLEQLLINLVQNAVEAGGHEVRVSWSADAAHVVVRVADDGQGLPRAGNLFVPFFTTKAGGSGIGLALSRQIAEAHGGTLELRDRTDARGAEAVLRLPV